MHVVASCSVYEWQLCSLSLFLYAEGHHQGMMICHLYECHLFVCFVVCVLCVRVCACASECLSVCDA